MEKSVSSFLFNIRFILLLAIVGLLSILACNDDDGALFEPVNNVGTFIGALPNEVPVPVGNPLSEAKIELGRQLFWDPIMSGNKDVSCASCHHPEKGYADAVDLSIGVGGSGLGEDRIGNILAARNAPTVINSAFNGILLDNTTNAQNAPMFWDNRAMGLEAQAILPLLSQEEMRGTEIPEDELYDILVNRLNQIPEYVQAFEAAYGSEGITIERVGMAIASFERTIIASNSAFDRYMRGDLTAMTQQQINGMNAFINVGCAECHNGPMFSDYQLHVLGVPDNPKLPQTDAATGDYAFRTPTLRNLGLTAPYMHNGVQSSLVEVMDFYEDISEGNNGAINENLSSNDIDGLARDLDMEDDVNNAIIAFMDALNDPNFDTTIPESVPSGLPVGGNIGN